MSSIKNIVFDLGQVIVSFKPEEFLNEYNLSKEDKDMIDKVFFNMDAFYAMDDGYVTLEDYYKLHYKELPERLWNIAYDSFCHYPEKRRFTDGIIDLIKVLKDNYNIYILSNNNMESYYYLSKTVLGKLIDGWIISAKYHVVKPHDEIYQVLFKEFNLLPEECLFVDDRDINIEAGIRNGMDGIVFKDTDSLKKELNNRNII